MTVYLRPEDFADPPAPFRTGRAGHVWAAGETLERDLGLHLSANTTHALIGHGVIGELDALPLMGEIGGGSDSVIPQHALDAAVRILVRADRKTYGARNRGWEFDAGRDDRGRPCRVRIDNREYQRGLVRLTDLIHAAGRQGHAVWLRI